MNIKPTKATDPKISAVIPITILWHSANISVVGEIRTHNHLILDQAALPICLQPQMVGPK